MKRKFSNLKSLIIAGSIAYGALSIYAADFFELSPIRYSETAPENAVIELETKTFQRTAGYSTDLVFLKTVLLKKLTFQKLHTVLTAETAPEKFAHLKQREKSTILEILGDTTSMHEYVK